jgi:hypothetical protein
VNGYTAAELRDWAVEYLAEYDTEMRRFPELARKPHWNLWMMEARSEDALFAALVFRQGGLEFVCGTGDAFAIKRFSESDFPDDVERLPAEIARLFAVCDGSLYMAARMQRRGSAEDGRLWLGRNIS